MSDTPLPDANDHHIMIDLDSISARSYTKITPLSLTAIDHTMNGIVWYLRDEDTQPTRQEIQQSINSWLEVTTYYDGWYKVRIVSFLPGWDT